MLIKNKFCILILAFVLCIACSGCSITKKSDAAFFKVESKYDQFMSQTTNKSPDTPRRKENIVYIGSNDTTVMPRPGRPIPDEPNFEFENLRR